MHSSRKTTDIERAVLVGVDLGRAQEISSEDSLAELAALTEGAGAQVAGTVRQRLKEIDPRTFIGRGKVAEVRELARAAGASLVIFDDNLGAAQARNLEQELELRVIDRSQSFSTSSPSAHGLWRASCRSRSRSSPTCNPGSRANGCISRA